MPGDTRMTNHQFTNLFPERKESHHVPYRNVLRFDSRVRC